MDITIADIREAARHGLCRCDLCNRVGQLAGAVRDVLRTTPRCAHEGPPTPPNSPTPPRSRRRARPA